MRCVRKLIEYCKPRKVVRACELDKMLRVRERERVRGVCKQWFVASSFATLHLILKDAIILNSKIDYNFIPPLYQNISMRIMTQTAGSRTI